MTILLTAVGHFALILVSLYNAPKRLPQFWSVDGVKTTDGPSSMDDRALNLYLKTSSSRDDLSELLAFALDVQPERWAFDTNLNLLLKNFFDSGEPEMALSFLDAVVVSVRLPPRSAAFAVRELIKAGASLQEVSTVYDSLEKVGAYLSAHEVYSEWLMRRGSLNSCRQNLRTLQAAGVADENCVLTALEMCMDAQGGDAAACKVRWSDLSERVDFENHPKAVALACEALVASHMWRETTIDRTLLPALCLHVGKVATEPELVVDLLGAVEGKDRGHLVATSLASLFEGYLAGGRGDLQLQLYRYLYSRTDIDIETVTLKSAALASLLKAAERDRLLPSEWSELKHWFACHRTLERDSISAALKLAATMGDIDFAVEAYGSRRAATSVGRDVQLLLRCFRDAAHAKQLAGLSAQLLAEKPSLLGTRTVDELVNAHLRVCGLSFTLRSFVPLLRAGSGRVGPSAVTNVLIYFERYWRDYAHETEAGVSEDAAVVSKLLRDLPQRDRADTALGTQLWASLVATLLSRGNSEEAVAVLREMEESHAALDVARALELGVYSAVEGSFPLLTKSASEAIEGLPRGGSIAFILQGVPQELRLSAGSKRACCSVDGVITFLGGFLLLSGDYKAPVGVHLLQTIFEDAVQSKLYGKASQAIMLLEQSRLVLDLEAEEVRRALSVEGGVQVPVSLAGLRGQLARQWAATLVGKSLNRLQTRVKGSLRRIARSTQNVDKADSVK